MTHIYILSYLIFIFYIYLYLRLIINTRGVDQNGLMELANPPSTEGSCILAKYVVLT